MAGFAAVSILVAVFLIETPEKDAEVLGITIGLIAAAVVYMLKVTGRRGETGVRRLVVVYAAAYLTYLVAGAVATALLNPAPLPQARLQMKRGDPIQGGLIAQSGGSWYVTQDNKSVLVVSSRRVSRSFITFPKRPLDQSALDWFLDRSPAGR